MPRTTKGATQSVATKPAPKRRTAPKRRRAAAPAVTTAGGNFLARVYRQTQIPHKFVLWVYREIRTLVDEATLVVGRCCTFFDRFIVDCYHKIITNSLRNEAIFVKSTLEYTTSKRHKAHKLALMDASIEFAYARAANLGPEGRNFDTLYDRLPFDPAVFNILLESFERAVSGYDDWAHELLTLRLSPDGGTPEALVRRSRLELAMADCEARVGCDRSILSGVIRQVARIMVKVRGYQEQVARAYERIVYQMAKQYGRSAMQIEDNFQWGSFGLQRAIRYFDIGRGKSFSGIARWWIRAAILLKIKDEVNLVQVPNRVWKQHQKYEEKAHQMGCSGDLHAIAVLFGHTYADVEEVYNAVHINRPRGMEDRLTNSDSEDGGRLGDKIKDNKPNPEEQLEEHRDLRAPMYLHSLTHEQRQVICCSFGLFDFYPGGDGSADTATVERLRQIAVLETIKYKGAA